MRIILLLCSLPFVMRLVLYVIRIFSVRRFLEFKGSCRVGLLAGRMPRRTNLLLLIPVLRERCVITRALEHICEMNLDFVDLRVMIAGTCRESASDGTTTLDVVMQWLDLAADRVPSNVRIDCCEAEDYHGDRASQLNWAVRRASEIGWNDWDVVCVYDADSLPTHDSFAEAAAAFSALPGLSACQQPARFVRAANLMAERRENPLLVANALYQDTWTVISELPMWIDYFNCVSSGKKSHRHLYLIGHGEFLSRMAYDSFNFPEREVTDGIQLGYRMGFAGAVVMPLSAFCEDDVPHGLVSLIQQHKRWFGGCMNFASAYACAGENGGLLSLTQLGDGVWSQIRWAWASISFVILCGLALWLDHVVFAFLCMLCVVYCYVLPVLAHWVMHADIRVRFIDWVCLPFSILLKAIGPNLYFFEKLSKHSVKYEKVER